MSNKYTEFLLWSCCLIFLYNFHNFLDTNIITYWYIEYGLNFNNLLSFFGAFLAAIIAVVSWKIDNNRLISKSNLKILKNIIDNIVNIINNDSVYTQYNFDRTLKECNHYMELYNDPNFMMSNQDNKELKSYHSYEILFNENYYNNIFGKTMIEYLEFFNNYLNLTFKDDRYDDFLKMLNENFDKTYSYYINEYTYDKLKVQEKNGIFDRESLYYQLHTQYIIRYDYFLKCFQTFLNFNYFHESKKEDLFLFMIRHESIKLNHCSSKTRVFNTLSGFFKYIEVLCDIKKLY